MRLVDAATVTRLTPYDALIDALSDAFRADIVAPVRSAHTLATPAGDASLLLMPAWTGDVAQGRGFVGTKIVTVFPGNSAHSLASVLGTYVLMDGATGAPLAAIDGTVLTARRTACASALAARHLARADASRLVMVGAGQLAPHLVRAHATVRPIRHVACWARDGAKAEAFAASLRDDGFDAVATRDLQAAVGAAHVVSCATLSNAPLVRGEWLKPGTHLDLVGAFTPKMCEADDRALQVSRVFVDTRDGVLSKAGEFIGAIARGAFRKEDVAGDLAELCRSTVAARTADDQITLFKSVGASVEDLAAAMLVWSRLAA